MRIKGEFHPGRYLETKGPDKKVLLVMTEWRICLPKIEQRTSPESPEIGVSPPQEDVKAEPGGDAGHCACRGLMSCDWQTTSC